MNIGTRTFAVAPLFCELNALVTSLFTKGVGHRPLCISHWSVRQLCYNYTVEYRKGSDNVVADVLFRLPLPGETGQVTDDQFAFFLRC